MAAVQTINAEIHIRRGDYDELRKVYDPANPDPSLNEDHPFQVMPGELAIAQDTNTLFFRLDDGQDPSYTKANTTQRLIEMPFQANDLKVSDRNAVTAGWRKLGTHSGSMFCAILTVVAGDGLWRCLVNRSGNAASVMSLDADPNAKISALKYVDTADGGEIWANVSADCTMYAEVVDETTNRGGASSGWSFDPDFEYSETTPLGINVNATGLPSQSDTSECHAVLQKENGGFAASKNEPFEAHGLIDDFDDAVLPGVYKAMDASNGPSGRGRGSVMVTRSKLVSGHSMIADKLIQLYMVGGVTVSGVDAESELWIRDGYASAGSYTWSGWQRIDCDRERLLPKAGVYYVTTADEFTAALEAEVPAGTKKVVWVLTPLTITGNAAQEVYQVALTSNVSVYGDHITWSANGFTNSGGSRFTVRFFNQYVCFTYGIQTMVNVRLLMKRAYAAVLNIQSTLTSAYVAYEKRWDDGLSSADEGNPYSLNYPLPFTLAVWDNTASAGASTAQELFPLVLGNAVLDTPAELIDQHFVFNFVASVTRQCEYLGFYVVRGTGGTIRLGIYDAATHALMEQTDAITVQTSDYNKVKWVHLLNPITLVAGKEYYFSFAGFGDGYTVAPLGYKTDYGTSVYVEGVKYLGGSGSSTSELPATIPVDFAQYGPSKIRIWMACK